MKNRYERQKCDICGCDLVLSMELEHGRCNSCIEKEQEDKLHEK